MIELAATLVRNVRRRAVAASAVFILGVAWWWQLAAMHEWNELVWLGVTAVSVLSGFVALGWLRPARVGITAPQAMMLLAAIGMVAGLSLDVRRAGLLAISSMCAARAPDFVALARLHLQWLPWMHAGMAIGGLGALVWLRKTRRGCRRQFCARIVQNIACSAWMMVGMVAGVMMYYRLAAWLGSAGVPAMLGGMMGGMVWGMVVSVALYRLYMTLWPAPAAPQSAAVPQS
jgi:hypothetical protein